MAALLGSFDNHAAASPLDRGAAQSSIDRELGTILHLDRGAVAEPNDRVSVFRRANDLTAIDLLSGFQLARLRIRNEIQRSVGGLHSRIKAAQRYVSLQHRQRD